MYTVSEISKIINLARSNVIVRIKKGELKAFKLNRQMYMIEDEEAERFIREFTPRYKGHKSVGEFGRWLLEKFEEKHETPLSMAKKMRFTRQAVNAHINGMRAQSKPNYQTVVAYCYYLGGDPEEIWKLVEEDWG